MILSHIRTISDWMKFVSPPDIDRPSTTSLLCRFAQQELPGFEFSSIQVNKAGWTGWTATSTSTRDVWSFPFLLDVQDYKAAMHVDKNNLGPSYIIGLGDSSLVFYIFSCHRRLKFAVVEGDYSGGWLWLDDGSKLGRAKNIRSPHGMYASSRIC